MYRIEISNISQALGIDGRSPSKPKCLPISVAPSRVEPSRFDEPRKIGSYPAVLPLRLPELVSVGAHQLETGLAGESSVRNIRCSTTCMRKLDLHTCM